MTQVKVLESIKVGGKFRRPGDVFAIEDQALATSLAQRGLVALVDSATPADPAVPAASSEAPSTADAPPVDSAGTVFDEARHMRFKDSREPIINKDGTWRNKPGTGSV